ncbi:MAG: hypothetical protein MZV70_63015 [Desulfobacterales bacterium]|nr:hypothetical protein [Desulfobacterales bacterium]
MSTGASTPSRRLRPLAGHRDAQDHMSYLVLARKYRPQTFRRGPRAGAHHAHPRQRPVGGPCGSRDPFQRGRGEPARPRSPASWPRR